MNDTNLIESTKKNNSGRRIHQYWSEGFFEPFYYDDNNGKKKIAALCKLCNNVLKNTSIQRLQIHRKSCYNNSAKDSSSVWKTDDNFIVIEDSNSREPLIDLKIETEDYTNEKKKIKIDTTYETQCKTEEPSSSSLSLLFNIGSYTNLFPENENKLTEASCSSTASKPSINSNNNNNKKKPLDYLVAKFFVNSNIAFKEIESSAFHEFINEINPKYKIPDKEKLSTCLLNEIYHEVVKKQTENIKFESILLINLFKNHQAYNKILTFLYLPEGKKVFLNLFEYSIQTDFKEIITYAQEKFKTKIYAIVYNEKFDIDNKNCEMFTFNLEINKYFPENIFLVRCNLQIANELIANLIDKSLADNIYNILKDFKQPQNESLLIAYGAPKIFLPKKNNWLSYLDGFKYILDYLTILKQISLANVTINSKESSIDPLNIKLLQKPDFLINITYHIRNLTSVFEFIKKLKISNCTIADAVQEWTLLKFTNTNILIMSDIRKKALQKFAIIANILHPKYRGEQLNNEEKNLGEEFLFSYLNSGGLESYQNYCTKKNVFESLLEKKNLSWQTFWCLASRKHPALSELAQRLLQIPAVSEHEFDLDEITNNNDLNEDYFKKFLHVRYALKNNDI